MKLISFLAAAASLALGVSAVAAYLNAESTAIYAAAASLLIVLGAVRDYSPRAVRWEPARSRVARCSSSPTNRAHRLAA